jgi:hypothetical protein
VSNGNKFSALINNQRRLKWNCEYRSSCWWCLCLFLFLLLQILSQTVPLIVQRAIPAVIMDAWALMTFASQDAKISGSNVNYAARWYPHRHPYPRQHHQTLDNDKFWSIYFLAVTTALEMIRAVRLKHVPLFLSITPWSSRLPSGRLDTFLMHRALTRTSRNQNIWTAKA